MLNKYIFEDESSIPQIMDLIRSIDNYSEIEGLINKTYEQALKKRISDNYHFILADKSKFEQNNVSYDNITFDFLGLLKNKKDIEFSVTLAVKNPEFIEDRKEGEKKMQKTYLAKGQSKIAIMPLAFHALGHMDFREITGEAESTYTSEVMAFLYQYELSENLFNKLDIIPFYRTINTLIEPSGEFHKKASNSAIFLRTDTFEKNIEKIIKHYYFRKKIKEKL